MERQLKERLIGAAVLIAAAVVLVPEIFSGSASRVVATDIASSATSVDAADSSATSGQLKTYHIQLQDHGDATPPLEAEVNSSASQSSTDIASVASNPTGANPVSLAVTSSSSSAASSLSAPATHPSATAKTSAPKPTAEPIKKAVTSGKGWVVQIGSFGADAKAKQIVGNLKAKDYPAYSGPVTVKGKTLYRVRVGPLDERTAADALLKQLKSAYPEASVVPQAR